MSGEDTVVDITTADPVQAAQNAIEHYQSMFDSALIERNRHQDLVLKWQARMEEAQANAAAWIYAKQDLEAAAQRRRERGRQ